MMRRSEDHGLDGARERLFVVLLREEVEILHLGGGFDAVATTRNFWRPCFRFI